MRSLWFSSGVYSRVYKYTSMCETHCVHAEVSHGEASVILLTCTLCLKAVTKPKIRPNLCKSRTISQLCFALPKDAKIEPYFKLATPHLNSAISSLTLHSLLNNVCLLKECQLFRVLPEQPAHLIDLRIIH